MDALEFACRYSYKSNFLDYCGPTHAFQQFADFLQSPSPEKGEKIKSLLKDFYSLHAYLKLIAEKNSLQPFDYKVLEAYWLGNELLESVSRKDLRQMILQEFSKPGLLPKRIAEQKAESVPEGALPHHSFHVLHINFITPKLDAITKNLSDCIVQWGKIQKINSKKGKLQVKGIELIRANAEFALEEKIKNVEIGFAGNARKGDFVSVHWQQAVQKLSEGQLRSLQKYTFQNLRAANLK